VSFNVSFSHENRLFDRRNPALRLAPRLGMQSAVPSPTPTPAQESPSSPKEFASSSGVANSLLRHKVDPEYPWEARERHITGDVLLWIVIDKSGNVASIRVEKGRPILVDAAVEAVKQWKYRPFVLHGEPVEVTRQLR